MRTPDGEWTVEVLRTRAGECLRVRRRLRPGQISPTGWAPTGQIRATVAQVADLLGDAFATLEPVDR